MTKSGLEHDVSKMIDKFMIQLAAPASKHTTTGFALTLFFALIITDFDCSLIYL